MNDKARMQSDELMTKQESRDFMSDCPPLVLSRFFVIRHSPFVISPVDTLASVCLHAAVKWLVLLLLVFLFAANSCTTLVNRRDLYSPEPAPVSLQAMRQMRTATTTTRMTHREEIAPAGY